MKILLIHPTPRPFITLDIALLRAAFSVQAQRIRFRPPSHFVTDTLAALAAVPQAEVVLAWFGGLHALLPFALARLLGKRCAVIASGVDVAAVPELGYGHMRPGWLRPVGRLVFRLAHRVFAVSTFTAQEALQNAQVPAAKVRVIPHGLPPLDRTPAAHARTGVLTVATATDRTLRLKGLTTFVRAAAHLPEVPFEIVGGGDPATLQSLRRDAPSNVTFTGWCTPQALKARMCNSAVYAQLSAYESFGMALAEAMQCGCRPVVTRRGALPEVVGPTGWYVPYGDPEATASAIQDALAAASAASADACRRIAERFPLHRRREALVHALRTLVR